MLGGPWFVSGEVIHGEKRGRDLGYPTANIRLDRTCGLKHGIYAVRVGRGNERFDGVASFGRRPTFDNGAPLLEVFLFDFKGDLYGATLDVAFIGFIREELKFDSVEALVRRMDDDSAEARAALAAAPARSRSSEMSSIEVASALSDGPAALIRQPSPRRRSLRQHSQPGFRAAPRSRARPGSSSLRRPAYAASQLMDGIRPAAPGVTVAPSSGFRHPDESPMFARRTIRH